MYFWWPEVSRILFWYLLTSALDDAAVISIQVLLLMNSAKGNAVLWNTILNQLFKMISKFSQKYGISPLQQGLHTCFNYCNILIIMEQTLPLSNGRIQFSLSAVVIDLVFQLTVTNQVAALCQLLSATVTVAIYTEVSEWAEFNSKVLSRTQYLPVFVTCIVATPENASLVMPTWSVIVCTTHSTARLPKSCTKFKSLYQWNRSR